MREQTETAIEAADAVMFVIDARMGLTPADRVFADLARSRGKPVVLVANKSEGRQGVAGTAEAYGLGLGEPVPISAEHGEGLSDLYDALRDLMPEPTTMTRTKTTTMPTRKISAARGRSASPSSAGPMPASRR